MDDRLQANLVPDDLLMHLAPLGLSHGPSREQGAGSALGPDVGVPSPLPSLGSKDKDVQSWAWHRSRAGSLCTPHPMPVSREVMAKQQP